MEEGTTEDVTTEHEEDCTEVTWTENTEAFATEYFEADDTTFNPLAEQDAEVIEESYGNDEEKAIVTHEASISSVETRVVQSTGFSEENTIKGFATVTKNIQVS